MCIQYHFSYCVNFEVFKQKISVLFEMYNKLLSLWLMYPSV